MRHRPPRGQLDTYRQVGYKAYACRGRKSGEYTQTVETLQ
jgi:hypothetical protein